MVSTRILREIKNSHLKYDNTIVDKTEDLDNQLIKLEHDLLNLEEAVVDGGSNPTNLVLNAIHDSMVTVVDDYRGTLNIAGINIANHNPAGLNYGNGNLGAIVGQMGAQALDLYAIGGAGLTNWATVALQSWPTVNDQWANNWLLKIGDHGGAASKELYNGVVNTYFYGVDGINNDDGDLTGTFQVFSRDGQGRSIGYISPSDPYTGGGITITNRFDNNAAIVGGNQIANHRNTIIDGIINVLTNNGVEATHNAGGINYATYSFNHGGQACVFKDHAGQLKEVTALKELVAALFIAETHRNYLTVLVNPAMLDLFKAGYAGGGQTNNANGNACSYNGNFLTFISDGCHPMAHGGTVPPVGLQDHLPLAGHDYRPDLGGAFLVNGGVANNGNTLRIYDIGNPAPFRYYAIVGPNGVPELFHYDVADPNNEMHDNNYQVRYQEAKIIYDWLDWSKSVFCAAVIDKYSINNPGNLFNTLQGQLQVAHNNAFVTAGHWPIVQLDVTNAQQILTTAEQNVDAGEKLFLSYLQPSTSITNPFENIEKREKAEQVLNTAKQTLTTAQQTFDDLSNALNAINGWQQVLNDYSADMAGGYCNGAAGGYAGLVKRGSFDDYIKAKAIQFFEEKLVHGADGYANNFHGLLMSQITNGLNAIKVAEGITAVGVAAHRCISVEASADVGHPDFNAHVMVANNIEYNDLYCGLLVNNLDW